MAVELNWVPSARASVLHAVDAILRGWTLTDPLLAAELDEPARQIASRCDWEGIAPARLFEHLIPLSVGISSNSELADLALKKLLGRERASNVSAELARAIARGEAGFRAIRPSADSELQFRVGPLHEQWEARGPGMLAQLQRLTTASLLVDSAQAVLVDPAVGGGGAAHWSYNSVRIEAVLANPLPDLPETVRLAWLLAQLNLDLPEFQGEMLRERAFWVGGLALLPAVLAAAQEVELTHLDPALLERCGQAWKLGEIDAETLWSWWDTYVASRPAWQVGLAALDRMLPQSTARSGQV